MKTKYSLLILLIIKVLISCEPEITSFTPDAGTADFSVYVALGGSQTAGFANNELYKSGQIVSFPNILSRQLLHVGGGEFRQPLMRDELGFGNKLILTQIAGCNEDSLIWTVAAGGIPDNDNMLNIFEDEGSFHNMGVPGALIHHLTMPLNSTQGLYYQYFARFASSSTASPLSDALAMQPSFFSLWIGLSDILDHAVSGGLLHPIMEPEDFDEKIVTLLQQLTSTASGGVIGNIPDILQFPYFNHIPARGLWAVDSLSNNGIRMLVQGELVLLPAALAVRCEQLGTQDNPIPVGLYLNAEQVSHIRNRITALNNIIRNRASEFEIAHADINSLIQGISNGLVFEGIYFNNQYITGGLFSLDGVNLSRRGNALTANAFIDAINLQYGSTVPRISITQFQSIEYP